MEAVLDFEASMERLWAQVEAILEEQPAEWNYHRFIHREIEREPNEAAAEQMMRRHCEVVVDDVVYTSWLMGTAAELEEIESTFSDLLSSMEDMVSELEEDEDDEIGDLMKVDDLLKVGEERLTTLQERVNRFAKERAVLTDFWLGGGGVNSDEDEDEGFVEGDDSDAGDDGNDGDTDQN